MHSQHQFPKKNEITRKENPITGSNMHNHFGNSTGTWHIMAHHHANNIHSKTQHGRDKLEYGIGRCRPDIRIPKHSTAPSHAKPPNCSRCQRMWQNEFDYPQIFLLRKNTSTQRTKKRNCTQPPHLSLAVQERLFPQVWFKTLMGKVPIVWKHFFLAWRGMPAKTKNSSQNYSRSSLKSSPCEKGELRAQIPKVAKVETYFQKGKLISCRYSISLAKWKSRPSAVQSYTLLASVSHTEGSHIMAHFSFPSLTDL